MRFNHDGDCDVASEDSTKDMRQSEKAGIARSTHRGKVEALECDSVFSLAARLWQGAIVDI